MREGAIISRFFAPLASAEPGSFALTDDAAILTPPAGAQLVVTTDSVIEGVHVLPSATPAQYARKLVRRNLSDLAAMGATPWRYLLNLHLPVANESWLTEFANTLRAEQEQFGMVLAGGDTTLGGERVHLTLTCLGLNDAAPLRRNGAQVGDAIYVSGTIGDAALGLQLLLEQASTDPFLVERYHTPTPRLSLGTALRGKASAALDCSDGLLKDLSRLCTASGVGAVIQREAIPLSDAARALHSRPDFWNCVLTGGDDYELIFTAPAIAALPAGVTRIGSITATQGVRVDDARGADVTPAQSGWEY